MTTPYALIHTTSLPDPQPPRFNRQSTVHRSQYLLLQSHAQEATPRGLQPDYEQSWDEETVKRSNTFMRSAIARKCPKCKEPGQLDCFYQLSLPHYVRPSPVGKETAKELVQSWYSVTARTGDDLIVARDPSEIGRIICNDSFVLGLDPSTFLRRLDISILLKYPDSRRPKTRFHH
jgi:hypothetical protein